MIENLLTLLGFSRCPRCNKWTRQLISGNDEPSLSKVGVCPECDEELMNLGF